MSAEEFVIWLQGFAQAANEYNITPKQWQNVKDKLDTVEIEQYAISEENIEVDGELSDYIDWCTTTTHSGSTDIFYYNNT